MISGFWIWPCFFDRISLSKVMSQKSWLVGCPTSILAEKSHCRLFLRACFKWQKFAVLSKNLILCKNKWYFDCWGQFAQSWEFSKISEFFVKKCGLSRVQKGVGGHQIFVELWYVGHIALGLVFAIKESTIFYLRLKFASRRNFDPPNYEAFASPAVNGIKN